MNHVTQIDTIELIGIIGTASALENRSTAGLAVQMGALGAMGGLFECQVALEGAFVGSVGMLSGWGIFLACICGPMTLAAYKSLSPCLAGGWLCHWPFLFGALVVRLRSRRGW